jgi:3-oxoacyl-[acyl-carrier protein] reductase
VQGDVSQPEDIQRRFSETKKAYAKLDILVNSVGVYEFAPLEAITPEHIHSNSISTFLAYCLPRKKGSS